MGDRWTPEDPCTYCGATNNASHHHGCRNYGLYDDDGNPIPAKQKDPIMDELVYFSASYLCIPLSKADEIRRLLLNISGEHEVSFTYSNNAVVEDN